MCGAVKFTVSGDLNPTDACHCVQCRKFSSHYFVSTDVPRRALTITGYEHLAWYESSKKARRGFCSRCGCSLFFDSPVKDLISIAMGAFDGETETQMGLHMFVTEKGDYYTMRDGLPQYPRNPAQPFNAE
jgi:hypothetical protein